MSLTALTLPRTHGCLPRRNARTRDAPSESLGNASSARKKVRFGRSPIGSWPAERLGLQFPGASSHNASGRVRAVPVSDTTPLQRGGSADCHGHSGSRTPATEHHPESAWRASFAWVKDGDGTIRKSERRLRCCGPHHEVRHALANLLLTPDESLHYVNTVDGPRVDSNDRRRLWPRRPRIES